jgi:uncharacterized protein
MRSIPRYCYYLSKEALYPGSDFRMSEEVVEEFTRTYIQSQPGPEITFGWQGGEPTLMGLEFFQRAVAAQRRHAPPGVRILNTLQTNGRHLTPQWCQFFRTHGFLVGISIDGPERLHDAYRVDKGGNPSFRSTMDGLGLLQTHGVEFNVLTTLHAANAEHPLEVYRFLRDEVRTHFIQFIPIVEEDVAGPGVVSDCSITGEQYGEFLVQVFDEWVRRDVGKVFVQLFDVALAAWVGMPAPLCIFQEECGGALAMEHNGDLYSCDHFVFPDHRLGNILDTPMDQMVRGEHQGAFGTAKRTTLPEYCRQCEVRFVCNGGCPKDRLIDTPDGEPGLNYLCAGYRRFFNHVRPAMEFMAAQLGKGQAPAAIMEEFAGRVYG